MKNYYNSAKGKKNPIKKWAKDLNRYFSIEDLSQHLHSLRK
jgi:hypothetical protein